MGYRELVGMVMKMWGGLVGADLSRTKDGRGLGRVDLSDKLYRSRRMD